MSEVARRRPEPRVRPAAAMLSEPVMGFFTILALALAFAEAVLDLPPRFDRALGMCLWGIIALFAVEYLAGLVRAPDRRAFVLSAWRLLDLAIIVGPFVTLVLPTWTVARATPVLRLFRSAKNVRERFDRRTSIDADRHGLVLVRGACCAYAAPFSAVRIS